MKDSVQIGDLTLTEKGPFFIIAGPCVIETEEITLEVARYLKETREAMNIPIIFKTSYDNANRTSRDSYRGPGLEKGLAIIKRVKDETGLPVLSDVHCRQDKMTRSVSTEPVLQSTQC